jgi:hypothetical protein
LKKLAGPEQSEASLSQARIEFCLLKKKGAAIEIQSGSKAGH